MIRAFKIPEEAELHDGTYLYEFDWPEDVGFKKNIATRYITHYKCIAKRKDYRTFEPLSAEYKGKTVKRKLKG